MMTRTPEPMATSRFGRGRLYERASLLLLALVVAACARHEHVPRHTHVPDQIFYVAPPKDTFLAAQTIQGWVDAQPPNTRAISQHRWKIWSNINRSSGQRVNGVDLPIWETWRSGAELFLDSAVAERNTKAHPFQIPDQFVNPQEIEIHGGGQVLAHVLSFNRFTEELRTHVVSHRYFDSDALHQLNERMTGLPIADRNIDYVPPTAIMTKPVFWIVSGTAPTMMPYWNGNSDDATTTPNLPEPFTWKQCVLIDPIGDARNDVDRACNPKPICAGSKVKCGSIVMRAGTYPVIRVNASRADRTLYALRLTPAEVESLATYKLILDDTNAKPRQVQNGDLALLVAMHVSTRETEDWTWQTFWWSPHPSRVPPNPPHAEAAPPSVPAPWNQFVSCTAYVMKPESTPICFNPYLETNLVGLENAARTKGDYTGVSSNCKSCHRVAMFPQPKEHCCDFLNAEYVADGDPKWFAGKVKTSFLWSIPFRAHKAPFTVPR